MTLGARGKLVVVGFLLALGVALTYFEMRGTLPQPWGTLSSIGYIAISDTILGAVILLAPFFALFGISTYFFARAVGFLGKARSDTDV